MSLRRLCLSLLLLVPMPASAQSAAILAALKDGDSPRVLVAAHRGAHDAAPENSLAAIENAITEARQQRDAVLKRTPHVCRPTRARHVTSWRHGGESRAGWLVREHPTCQTKV